MNTTLTLRSRLNSGLTPSLTWAFASLIFTYGLGDLISTALALNYGAGYEAHPITAWAMQSGLAPLILFKLIALAIIYALGRFVATDTNRYSRWSYLFCLYFGTCFYFLVTISNLLTITAGYDLYHYFVR